MFGSFRFFQRHHSKCRMNLFLPLLFVSLPICIWVDMPTKREKSRKKWQNIFLGLCFAWWSCQNDASSYSPVSRTRVRAPSNSDVDFLLSQVSHKGEIWREKSISFWKAEKREKRLLVVFSAYFQSLKFVFVKICPIYVVIDWIIVCCLLFCDTCDSKNAKTPGMRLYARARGRDVIGIFTIRIGCSRLLFRGWVFSRSLPFIENNTSFSPKQHVVFTKITRRFY